MAGTSRKQSSVRDQLPGLSQFNIFASFIAWFLAKPLFAGCDHGAKFVPEWAIALEK